MFVVDSVHYKQWPTTSWGREEGKNRFRNKYLLWNILFMAPRMKKIVILNLLWSKFLETMSDVLICYYIILITQPMRDQDL